MTNNHINNDETVRTYSSHVHEYTSGTVPQVTNEVAEWIDFSLSHINKTGRILELGSGTGRDAEYIINKGYDLEASDAADGFVDHLRAIGLNVRKLNALDGAAYGGDYDIVFANAVMLHFNESEFSDVLSNVSNSLKPGGYFSFSVKRGIGDEITTRKVGGPRYFNYWEKDKLEQRLSSAHFKIIDCKEKSDYRPNKPGWLFLITRKDSTGRS